VGKLYSGSTSLVCLAGVRSMWLFAIWIACLQALCVGLTDSGWSAAMAWLFGNLYGAFCAGTSGTGGDIVGAGGGCAALKTTCIKLLVCIKTILVNIVRIVDSIQAYVSNYNNYD